MSNVTYKRVRKLKNGKVEVQFTDAAGNSKKEVCHDPLSCREHASLFAPLASGLGSILNSLPEEDEDGDSVSADDYASKTVHSPYADTIIFDTPTCPSCGEKGMVTLVKDEYEEWRKGALIQNAFPSMPAPIREQLKTGYHPECWTKTFGSDED
jgi:hypothetical protein